MMDLKSWSRQQLPDRGHCTVLIISTSYYCCCQHSNLQQSFQKNAKSCVYYYCQFYCDMSLTQCNQRVRAIRCRVVSCCYVVVQIWSLDDNLHENGFSFSRQTDYYYQTTATMLIEYIQGLHAPHLAFDRIDKLIPSAKHSLFLFIQNICF